MGHIDRFDIKNLIQKYNLSIFVETGTGSGMSLDHAHQFNFRTLYSIEIYKPIFDVAKQKYKAFDNVMLINADSETGLETVLKELNLEHNILFWLDAHFPGADFGHTSYASENNNKIRIPLESELMTIKKFRTQNKDVFIIDDLRIYEDGPFTGGIWPERHLLGGNGIEFIHNIFNETHSITKDYREQGYLILEPK